VRLAAGDLISHDTVAIDVERRRRVVESHYLLSVRGIHAGNRERKLRLVQIALQPLRVLVDADEQERDARVVLVSRVGRFQVRQLRTAGPSPGGEKIQQQHFLAQP
jgi:hypothetical protein